MSGFLRPIEGENKMKNRGLGIGFMFWVFCVLGGGFALCPQYDRRSVRRASRFWDARAHASRR